MDSLNDRLETFFMAYLNGNNSEIMKGLALKLLTEIREPKIITKEFSTIVVKGEFEGLVSNPDALNKVLKEEVFSKIGIEIMKAGAYTGETHEIGVNKFREIYTVKTFR